MYMYIALLLYGPLTRYCDAMWAVDLHAWLTVLVDPSNRCCIFLVVSADSLPLPPPIAIRRSDLDR